VILIALSIEEVITFTPKLIQIVLYLFLRDAGFLDHVKAILLINSRPSGAYLSRLKRLGRMIERGLNCRIYVEFSWSGRYCYSSSSKDNVTTVNLPGSGKGEWFDYLHSVHTVGEERWLLESAHHFRYWLNQTVDEIQRRPRQVWLIVLQQEISEASPLLDYYRLGVLITAGFGRAQLHELKIVHGIPTYTVEDVHVGKFDEMAYVGETLLTDAELETRGTSTEICANIACWLLRITPLSEQLQSNCPRWIMTFVEEICISYDSDTSDWEIET